MKYPRFCINWQRFIIFLAVIAGMVRAGNAIAGEPSQLAGGRTPLWQIGTADNSAAEFAHGPGDYRAYQQPALFLIGQSDPKQDWPYVQPGEVDRSWAPGTPQTFAIVFAIKQAPGASCRLVLDFVDTHSAQPPKLDVAINGASWQFQTPPGAGDESVYGNPSQGREHIIAIDVPARVLQAGNNRVTITTESGSWVVWDAVRFESPDNMELAPVARQTCIHSITSPTVLIRHQDQLFQPIEVDLLHIGQGGQAAFWIGEEPIQEMAIQPGRQTFEVVHPAVKTPKAITVRIDVDGESVAKKQVTVQPVRRWIVYLLHNTHLDIGYTHTQDDVEKRQIEFLDRALELIEKTNGYPPEARFVWQPEGLWPVESYLNQASAAERAAFIEAARGERIGLDALYGNALTGLYNGEELFALVDYAARLREKYGISLESATITDVPGLTWGIVPVLAQIGVKYFSISPNIGHRVGHAHIQDDHPFYWISPCGRYKILCWQTGRAYSWLFSGFQEKPIFDYLRELEASNYPYDMVQCRVTVGGDNGYPDPHLPEQVKAWNERYAYPRIVIASTSQMFRDFEKEYGAQIPVVRGDFTPYWEDGAASTAADTALCRQATEMLIQCQTLWAMLQPGMFPEDRFYASWRNAVLYDEHTWGAHNSISEPDSEFAKSQAAHKQKFALDAAAIARELIVEATSKRAARDAEVNAVEVFNTLSWPRTDLVLLPADLPRIGDRVKTAAGHVVASQRLATGELAFIARDVPPLGSAKYLIETGPADALGEARADENGLINRLLTVAINDQTGAIDALTIAGSEHNFAQGRGLNDYVYVAGRDSENRHYVQDTQISVQDAGPLVATVRITSAAPGARLLVRELRLVDGLDRLDIRNVVDKLPIREKEGVHFGFDFNLPEAAVHMDMPWVVIQPEADQIPGACRNYFAIQRWADVSNLECGATLATVDAPLVQIGAIRTDVSHPFHTEDWLQHIEPSSTLFSYVMNNYWETNYKADQDGLISFRYSIHPHQRQYQQIEAMRFGIERNRPLVIIPVRLDGPDSKPSLFTLSNPDVIVTSVKPSRDGQATMIRLFAASGESESCTLHAAGSKAFYRSNSTESRGQHVASPLNLAAYEIVYLRME